jgi:hypothetical protein
MVIVTRSLTMITSCNEMVNINYVATCVTITLNQQLPCKWHTMLMCMIMPHVQLSKDQWHLELTTFLQLNINCIG